MRIVGSGADKIGKISQEPLIELQRPCGCAWYIIEIEKSTRLSSLTVTDLDLEPAAYEPISRVVNTVSSYDQTAREDLWCRSSSRLSPQSSR